MILLTLRDADIRTLMNLLLLQETFDAFELRGVTVQSFARLDIEGAQVPAVESVGEGDKPERTYCKWKAIRPFVQQFIKIGGKPRYIKIVLSYPQERVAERFTDAQALFVNVIFDKDTVNITTGVSMRVFSLEKSVESSWDEHVSGFFKKHNLFKTEGE